MPTNNLTTGHKVVAADFDPVVVNTIGTAAAGFTDGGSQAKTMFDGHLVMVRIVVTNASTITATTGDFADVLMFTVDPAYRPANVINAVAGNGHTTGEAVLNSDGTVNLRAGSDSFASGNTIRATFTFLVE